MKILLAALLAAAPLAFAADAPKEPWQSFDVALEPQKMHEECARMEQGESRRYHWKSDAAVDFNIHYHQGNDVFYPVKREAMRGDGGSFKAKTAGDYCWMWTARKAKSRLEGRLENPSSMLPPATREK